MKYGNRIIIGGYYNPPPVVREVMAILYDNIEKVVPPTARAHVRIFRRKHKVLDLPTGNIVKVTAYHWECEVGTPLPEAKKK